MSTAAKWVVGVIAALLVVGLLVWARGSDGHRGDESDSAALSSLSR